MGLFSRQESFDKAVVELPTGELRPLTKSEFEALPLHDRVRAILSKKLKFYRGVKEVSMKEALGDR